MSNERLVALPPNPHQGRAAPGPALSALSIVRGLSLADEEGLGTLTLPGFIREVTERFAGREALVQTHPDGRALRYVDAEGPIARHPTVNTDWIEPRHCYGNTETFTLSAVFIANTSRKVAGASHGIPLPGNTLKIVDPLERSVVPVGVQGEIAVKGPTLMLGYLGIPLSETLDDEGFFRTGDGGYVDEHGRLFWEGRLNGIIKTGGANVSPLEIDDVIQACPGVKRVQTVGVPDELLGELVVSCIVAELGSLLDETRIRDFAKEKLASFKVPRRVLFFAEHDLQLTGSAKVKTNLLRELATKPLQ